MSLTIHNDLEQGSDEWLAARRGMITASTIGRLITTRKLGAIDYDCPECNAAKDNPCQSLRKPGAVIKTLHPARAEHARGQASSLIIEPASNDESRNYTLLLAGERLTGVTETTRMTDDMWRGVEVEPIARDFYSEKYAPVTELGFMVLERDGFRLGYSPDGLVGEDGLIEIKAPRAKGHISTILAGHPPIEYMAQLQCGLLVSGRKWIDFISFHGGLPMYVKRVYAQQVWFTAITQAAIKAEQNIVEIQRLYDEASVDLHPTQRLLMDQDMVI